MTSVFRGLMILGVYNSIGEGKAEKRTLGSNIFENYQPPKTTFKNSLGNVLRKDFLDSKVTVLSISDHCSICNIISNILMEDLRQPFLTVSEYEIAAPSSGENNNFTIEYRSMIHGFVILVMKHVTDLFSEFQKLCKWSTWNPRAKHLILMMTEPSHNELQLFFEKCWNHRVINIAVMIYNRDDGYTYNPYRNNIFLENVNSSELFYNKLRNMMGYRIRTKYIPSIGKNAAKWIPEEHRFEFSGIDWGYAQTFFKSVNATPEYINSTNADVRRLANFSVRVSYWMEHKFHANVELWFNPMMTNFKFHDRFEPTYSLGFNGVYILAPKSGIKLPSAFKPYTKLTWITVGLSIVICSFYTKLLYKRENINDDVFMSSYGMFLGQYYPKKNFRGLENGVYVLWSFYSLLILNAYQGELYGALATVTFYPEIDTVTELPLRTKVIYTYNNLAPIVKQHIPQGITVIPTTANSYQAIMTHHRDYFYAFTKGTVDFAVKRKKYSENGLPFYHIMAESLVPMHMLYFVPYGSPYVDKLNQVTLACRESGLDQYWNNAVDLQALLGGVSVHFEDQSKKLKKLSMRTQIIAFYILAGGMTASCLCCVYEVWFSKKKKNE